MKTLFTLSVLLLLAACAPQWPEFVTKGVVVKLCMNKAVIYKYQDRYYTFWGGWMEVSGPEVCT